MVRIGMVGEDPYDTTSIINLLTQKYSGKAKFEIIARGVKGHQLGTDKLKRTIQYEAKNKAFNLIVYIRDLDGFNTEALKFNERLKWFNDLNAEISDEGMLLLNIWELEALIFADFETFNRLYKTKHRFKGDPMLLKEPKDKLKELTFNLNRQFKESHCPDIFKELRFDIIHSNCLYFKSFIEELNLRCF